MAKVSQEFNKKDLSYSIPTPIIGLGDNFFLQHERNSVDIVSFMANFYSSSGRRASGAVTQNGTDWANDTLKIALSYGKDKDYTYFLQNTPMIFLEVLNNSNKVTNSVRRLPLWVHPVNNVGQLNRTGSNYGGGDNSPLTTEWDFTPSTEYKDQVIELDFKWFQKNGAVLPIRLVDYISNPGNQLRYQRGNALTPTGSGNKVVNTFQQPIRFRFGYINPTDNKSVHLGEPSEVLFLTLKWGLFTLDNDTYIYDYTVKRSL